jgi:phenylacetate-CoA ligase
MNVASAAGARWPSVARRTSFLALHEAAGIPVARTYRAVAEEQSVHGDRITSGRLAKLLAHCERHVPYYRRLLADVPRSDDPLAVLRSLPVLTRSTLMTRADELLADNLDARRCWWDASGGSTGEPVRFLRDRVHSAATTVALMRFHEACGRRVGEPVLFAWGAPDEILEGSESLKSRLLRWLSNDTTVNAFRLTDNSMQAFIDTVNARPPKLVVGYAQSLYEIARFAERVGSRVRPQIAIITSAGTLYDSMREAIERVFGCEVRDQYGSREIGPAALECRAHAGMHVLPWAVHVEVLAEDGRPLGPGEDGELVVTSLTNYAMPLVRYAIGDRGVLSAARSCVCGHTGTTLARVSGRIADTFVSAAGERVDGEFFTHILFHMPWVAKFQVLQRDYDDVAFRIVLAAGHHGAPEHDRERIARDARKVLGEACRVSFEFVPELHPGPSGKFRFTISEVAGPRAPRVAGP